MPDGQSGVLENLDGGVNAVSLPLAAPIAAIPEFERPAYVREPWKWGSALAGSPGGTIRWAIVGPNMIYPSQEYTDAAMPIDPVFNATIRAAFDRWEEVGNFDFVESYTGLADIVVIWDELSGQSSGTIGLANTYYSGSLAVHSYISFDIGRRYRLLDGTVLTVGTPQNSNTLNLYTLALHEIGHALGLDHEDDLPTIMNSYDNPAITDLTADEITGIEAIYGAKGSVIADDYAASTATTGAVSVGGSVTGRIEVAGDSDWFRVSLTAGAQYRIDVVAGTLADPYATLFNANGSSIAIDDDSGAGLNAQITYTATTTGTYYVGARGASATATGTYTVSVTQTGSADDYAATTATTGVVTTTAATNAVINSASDRDWFRLALSAGMTYTILMTAGTGSTITDPAMYLLNSAGSLISGSNGSGGALITFTPTTTGTYYIDAISRSGTGAYAISMTAAPAVSTDDYAGSTSTTGTIAIGGSATGSIETADDRDWFRVTLTAGVTYRVDLNGTTLADPMLYVRNASGVSVASDDDSGPGLNASLSYTPTTTGTYYLEARSVTTSGTGTYALTLTQTNPAPVIDYAADTTTTGVVVVGATLSSAINAAADVDWIRVSLTAGTLYRFDARGSASSGGTLTDPALQLLNSSGVALVADNDSGTGADARIMFRASTSGTYYLAMRSNSAAATGTYTLAATANPDDYAANTGTSGTVAVGGSAEGLVEVSGDRDWFRTTLTANTRYNIRLTGTAAGSALRWTESAFSVLSASGFQLATASSSGLGASASLTYTPSTSGTFFIDAAAYSNGVGGYTLSVALASAATEPGEGLTADGLAAVTTPPAIALDEPPLQLSQSTTVFVDDALRTVLAPPPPDLFTPPAEPQNHFMADTPFDQLFQQQFSNTYTLLPF